VLAAMGLQVNRLIRVSFGPFQLGDLPVGGVEVVKAKVLRDQLGKRLADEAGVDFDSEMPEPSATKLARKTANPHLRAAAPGKEAPPQRRAVRERTAPFHFVDDGQARDKRPEDRPMAADRPGSRNPRRPARPVEAERPGKPRKVFNPDGTETVFEEKTYGKKPKREAGADGKPPFKKDFAGKPDGDRKPFAKGPRKDFGDRPPRKDYADRPKRDFGDRPPRREGEDRPKRPYSPRPGSDGAARPQRAYGDRSPRREGDDRPKRPYSPRPGSDSPDRPKRSYGDKPRAPRPDGDRPKRPYAPRPAGAGADRPARSYGDKPRGPRPDGDRPKRPRGSGPGGDRPRRPRPPKA
jgi:23S rRNA pseudouridine2605 synthase